MSLESVMTDDEEMRRVYEFRDSMLEVIQDKMLPLLMKKALDAKKRHFYYIGILEEGGKNQIFTNVPAELQDIALLTLLQGSKKPFDTSEHYMHVERNKREET